MSDQPTREELVGALVQNVALAADGSFADRNPVLGRMRKCVYCGQRRRERGPVCCNPKYVVTNAAYEPRSAVAKKRKNPRLTRNRPPFFELHARLVEMESQPGYVEYEGISGIVEAAIKRRRRAKAKIRRDQQRLSRKINRRK